MTWSSLQFYNQYGVVYFWIFLKVYIKYIIIKAISRFRLSVYESERNINYYVLGIELTVRVGIETQLYLFVLNLCIQKVVCDLLL